MKVGVAWIALLTGMTAAVGILAALREREHSGKGQNIDLSLFDVGLMFMANLAQGYLATDSAPIRLGNAHAQIVPYQSFEASDDWFVLTVDNDEQYYRLAQAIAHPELWDDQRFRTNSGRVRYRTEVVSKLAKIFSGRKCKEWLEVLGRADVPAAPIYDLSMAILDSHAQSRQAVWEVSHPIAGDLPLMANALQHMSRTPAAPMGHPPLLGEHTCEVLTNVLGMCLSDLDDLESAGVVLAAHN